jgi:hypothetical protein
MAGNPEDQVVQGRKRVVAREVEEAELRQVETANREASAMTPPILVTPVRPAPIIEPVVVDPTTLGQRQRRSAHHRVYRWTQLCTMTAALLAAASIICSMVDEIHPARACAAPALGLGVLAIILSRHNPLAGRWRGWAIAATVFAAAALAFTWIEPAITREDPADLAPKSRQQVQSLPLRL